MRILTVTSLYPSPVQPGLANHNRQLLKHLARMHEVRVLAPVPWTREFKAKKHGFRIPTNRRASCDGIAVVHPRYYFPPKVARGSYGWFYYRSIRRAFVRTVAEFQPDLVYSPWAYPDGWAAVKLSHEAELPVVLQAMGSDVLCLPTRGRQLSRTLAALRNADAVSAVSGDMSRRLVEMGVLPQKVRVVYRGVDCERFQPGSRREARTRLGLPQDMPLVLFVGGLQAVKGIDVLLEACARLAARNDFNCVIVGDGPLRSHLQRRAQDLGLHHSTRFLGTVANDQLPDWYRSATVMVLPSHSEGVPNVLLEAAACGTPFVASSVGGIPEIAHLGVSHLVRPARPALLADAIERFLAAEPPECAATASPRSWDASAAEIADLFEEVVRRKNCTQKPLLSRHETKVTAARDPELLVR